MPPDKRNRSKPAVEGDDVRRNADSHAPCRGQSSMLDTPESRLELSITANKFMIPKNKTTGNGLDYKHNKVILTASDSRSWSDQGNTPGK